MKKIATVFCLFVLALSGCFRFGVDFKIKNNSGQIIDSISISNGYSSIKISNLEKDSSCSSYLDFNKNSKKMTKGDGSYILSVYKDTVKKEMGFGYFSNGAPLSTYYEINMEKDTILVTE